MGRNKKWTDSVAQEAHELYESGLSLRETALQYGGSGSALGNCFRRLGLSIRPGVARVLRALLQADDGDLVPMREIGGGSA